MASVGAGDARPAELAIAALTWSGTHKAKLFTIDDVGRVSCWVYNGNPFVPMWATGSISVRACPCATATPNHTDAVSCPYVHTQRSVYAVETLPDQDFFVAGVDGGVKYVRSTDAVGSRGGLLAWQLEPAVHTRACGC